MLIPTINIFKVHDELGTASAPLLCTCTDAYGNFAKYYLKYVLDENEYCGLVYEIICSKIAEYFGVSTPTIAFALTGNIIENNTKVNRNYLLNANSICFASKEIDPHKMLSDVDEIKDKTSFNKFLNPEQFLKIALFDLWVAHDDRNATNYNLLALTIDEGYYFYSIDHYHCFGGESYFNKDFSQLRVNQYKSLMTTTFGLSLRKYLVNPQILTNLVEAFNNIDLEKINIIVTNVFNQLPKEWKIDPNLQGTIISFLTDKKRNQEVIEIFKHLTTIKS
jgi:hypothetical protein